MAKKNNNKVFDSDPKGCLYIILIVVMIALLPLVPIILGFITLIHYFKFRRFRKKYKNISDFWLESEEKDEFLRFQKNITIADNNINHAKLKGERLNITKNKDGSFSSRSNAGKEINATIREAKNYLSNNFNDFKNYKYLPINRWNKMRNSYSKYFAISYSIIIWFITFILLFNSYFVEQYTNFFYFLGDIDLSYFLTTKQGFKEILIVLAITAGITLLGYYILSKISDFAFSKKYPKPEIVTADNINDY
ncbi:hypothetical protein [Psychroflexus tropicus]|uniref:hypothetical protein n=1 Tax=Psychroflexus tropicus TaxID=197345 RepID=UPI0003744587|nr:hypothetical protein [Psychroflexus tropicus]